jgi:hypothetical protein
MARLRAYDDQAEVDLFSRANEYAGPRSPRLWRFFPRKDQTEAAIREHRFAMKCQGWRLEKTIPAGGYS